MITTAQNPNPNPNPKPNPKNNRNLCGTTAVPEIACFAIKNSYDVTHRIPSLACSEPGCAGKHCYLQ